MFEAQTVEHFTSKYGVEKSIFHLDSEVNL